ncbi:MAG: glycosyltransferase [Defluviitaleaceae bacterium]|nr:glycosyltransferase [Defluviitaleaceae bacterium]
MRTKKFLLVATIVKLHVNVFYLSQFKWLREMGYEVHVAACNDMGEDCVIENCDKFFDMPFSRSPFGMGNFRSYFKLKKLIDENNYDIVACSTPVASMVARLAACAARRRGTKVIYHAHGFHFYKGAPLVNWILYYPAERFLARFTDMIITLNVEDTQRASEFNVPVENSLGPGVDFARVAASCNATLREELGIPEGSTLVLSLGELNKNKNHMTVLQAIARLTDVYYVICGEGKLREKLLRESKRLGCENRLILAGYKSNIGDFFNAADIFAFPSIREGIGQSSIEAMAAGLPMVTSRARGVTEYAKEGETALLCDYSDIDGFENNIQRLISDKNLRDHLSKNSREAAKKYSVESAQGVIKKIYTRLQQSKHAAIKANTSK